MPLGDGALALVRKAVEQLFGDDQRQYPVAEKLQPLVSVPGARLGAGVGHGPAQDVRVPAVVADLAGQSVQIRLRLAHSIPSSNRPRSEEHRVGKACASTSRSRWSRYKKKKN